MGTLYSIRILQANLGAPADYAQAGPVPTGFIWVLNWINFAQTGETAGYANFYGPCSPGSPTENLFATYELYSIHGLVNEQVKQVFNAGEYIGVEILDCPSGVNFLLSGYQLSTT